MIKYYYKIIIFFTFLFTYAVFVNAQTTGESALQESVQPREFSKTDWKRATEGIDYSADKVAESKKKKEEESAEGSNGRGGGSSAFFGGDASGIMKLLIIIIAAVVLILLVRSLLGLNNPKNKKIKNKLSSVNLDQIEENIHEADLDDFIRQAIEEQHFALAIRLYYLAILKELSLKNFIHWKKDKTNKHYLSEMRQSPLSGSFREITLIFERIWYGDSPIHANEFQRLEPKFRGMVHQISTLSTPTVK